MSARGFNIESLTVSPTNIPDLSRMTIVMRDVPDSKTTQALKQLSDIVNVWAGTCRRTEEPQRVTSAAASHALLFSTPPPPSKYRLLLVAQFNLAVVDYTGTNSLQREVLMVKVSYLPSRGDFKATATTRARPTYRELLEAQPHRAAVRDVGALFGAEVVDVGSRHIIFQLTSWSRRIDAFVRMVRAIAVAGVASVYVSALSHRLSLVYVCVNYYVSALTGPPIAFRSCTCALIIPRNIAPPSCSWSLGGSLRLRDQAL